MTKNLEFNEYGYLIPYQPILTDVVTFEQVFVESFPESITRRPLFEQYQAFNQLLYELLPNGFSQWINGSFVSRKSDPNDIDVVTFVDASLYDRYEKQFDVLRGWRNRRSKSVDGFFVRYYPENHRYRIRYEYDCTDWLNTFGTWKDRTQKTRNKGFITLNF